MSFLYYFKLICWEKGISSWGPWAGGAVLNFRSRSPNFYPTVPGFVCVVAIGGDIAADFRVGPLVFGFAISGRCVVKSLAEQLAHACQNSRNAFGINRMDAIGHGFLLLPHTSLLRSKQPNTLRKFAEFNYPPLPGLSNRRTVPKCPKRLQMSLGMANFSSIDIPRKGKSNNETRTLKDSFGKPKLQRGASHEGKDLTEAPADSSKHSRDAPVVTLDKSATVGPGMHHKKTSLSWSGKHSGQLVWKELQELVKRDTGPPSWYCYEDAGSRPENAPLFFCLPDIISNGLSLALHQEKLARLFEVRRLHVPVTDESSNEDLISIIEGAVREESSLRKDRPIYLMGEGYGALLAISVAARNPEIDLVLVLVDPATWCDKSSILPPGVDVLDAAPGPVSSSIPFLFSMSIGDPLTIVKAIVDPSLPRLEKSQQFMVALRDVLQVIATASVVLSRDVARRKVNQLQMAAHKAVFDMKNVKADVFVLYSGKPQNQNEAERLRQSIPSGTGRIFKDRRGALLLEDGIELASLIKATHMYRRAKLRNIVTDYVPPTDEEKECFRKAHLNLMKQLFSPVYFHAKGDGSVKRGLPKLTKERPILLVCNHTFVGFDLGVIIGSFMDDQDVFIRALAHPLLTIDQPGELMVDSSLPDLARLLGSVPVSGSNLYKLLAAKETVFLLPGGMREAVKRRGESYKLIWPAKPEFVRTAIRHGAVIIPMAAVGGDEFIKIIADQHQILNLPVIGDQLQRMGDQMPRARSPKEGVPEEGHMLGTVGIPTPPPRMYFIYQKPIYTHELRDSLNDKETVSALYQQVKSEIETGISYLLKKREEDPYQYFVPRVLYEKSWDKQAPTFKP